eukprot:6478010-Amphidinium_carterae.1
MPAALCDARTFAALRHFLHVLLVLSQVLKNRSLCHIYQMRLSSVRTTLTPSGNTSMKFVTP